MTCSLDSRKILAEIILPNDNCIIDSCTWTLQKFGTKLSDIKGNKKCLLEVCLTTDPFWQN